MQAGLEKLAGESLARSWKRGDGADLRIDRLLIDAGYLPGVIANVARKLGSAAMPSEGVGIRAGNKPMSTYWRRPGERHGHHWYVPNVSRTSELPHVQIDTNYWKLFLHARLATAPGDRGALTLYGKSANEHRLIAEHVAGSEVATRTEGHGLIVHEWVSRPSRPDNHWLDCLVDCAVGASIEGITCGTEPPHHSTRMRIKPSDLQKRPGNRHSARRVTRDH